MDNPVLDSNLSTGSDLSLSPEIKDYLRQTAKWSKLLAIVGYVMVALLVIIAIAMMFFMGSMLSGLADAGGMGALGGVGIGVVYLLLALLYFFPVRYLHKFSSQMKVALDTNNHTALTSSFSNLKSLYKFWGILTAIMIGFYALALVVGLVGGAAAFM